MPVLQSYIKVITLSLCLSDSPLLPPLEMVLRAHLTSQRDGEEMTTAVWLHQKHFATTLKFEQHDRDWKNMRWSGTSPGDGILNAMQEEEGGSSLFCLLWLFKWRNRKKLGNEGSSPSGQLAQGFGGWTALCLSSWPRTQNNKDCVEGDYCHAAEHPPAFTDPGTVNSKINADSEVLSSIAMHSHCHK